jgi:hypothetical protein
MGISPICVEKFRIAMKFFEHLRITNTKKNFRLRCKPGHLPYFLSLILPYILEIFIDRLNSLHVEKFAFIMPYF